MVLGSSAENHPRGVQARLRGLSTIGLPVPPPPAFLAEFFYLLVFRCLFHHLLFNCWPSREPRTGALAVGTRHITDAYGQGIAMSIEARSASSGAGCDGPGAVSLPLACGAPPASPFPLTGTVFPRPSPLAGTVFPRRSVLAPQVQTAPRPFSSLVQSE